MKAQCFYIHESSAPGTLSTSNARRCRCRCRCRKSCIIHSLLHAFTVISSPPCETTRAEFMPNAMNRVPAESTESTLRVS